MELLASFFVTLVTLANTIAPQANLPKVLGVETTSTSSAGLATNLTATSSGTVWSKAQTEFAQKKAALSSQYKAARAAKEQEFKNNLTTLKDEKKKTVVANLENVLLERGEKWCTHWSEVGARLDDLLSKVQSRRDKVKASGKDTTAADSAISAASTAIAAAKAAGTAQCAKTYTIGITNGDTGIGQDVRTTVQQFSTDIKSVISTMEAARKAIGDAISALRAIAGVDTDTATPSATTATSGGITR
ncbi:MAG TPA: hypothetical protein VF185_04685 [Patescibacteria group bacterium]